EPAAIRHDRRAIDGEATLQPLCRCFPTTIAAVDWCMNTTAISPVLRMSPALPADAAAYFAARLASHTDVADVHAALSSGEPGFVLVDSRGDTAWVQAHIPGAIHLPTAQIPSDAGGLLDREVPVVTYCWGRGATERTAPPLPWRAWATASRRCSAVSSTGSAKASQSRPGRGSSSVLPIRSPRRSRRWLAIAELWPELQRLSGEGMSPAST